MYPRDNKIIVKVNEMEIPLTSLPYRHPTGYYEQFLLFYLVSH